MIGALIILLTIITIGYSIFSYFMIKEIRVEELAAMYYVILTFLYLLGITWIFSLMDSIHPLN